MAFHLVGKLRHTALTFLNNLVLKAARQYDHALLLGIGSEELFTFPLHDFRDFSLFSSLFLLKFLEILVQDISCFLI